MQQEFADVDQQAAAHQQGAGQRQHQTAVHPQPGARTAGPARLPANTPPGEQVTQHHGAETAGDDETADHDLQGSIAMHPGVGKAGGQGREAGVAEGRDRVEDRLKNAFADVPVGRQREIDEQGAEGFGDEGEDDDEAHRTGDVGEVLFRDHLAKHLAIVQAHAAEQEAGEVKGQRHDAEAADLDETEQDDLPGGGKKERRVFHRQTGDADGAGAGEEGVQPGQVDPIHNGTRQFEQEGAEGDDEGKAAHEQPAGTQVQPCDLGLVTQGAQAERGQHRSLGETEHKQVKLGIRQPAGQCCQQQG